MLNLRNIFQKLAYDYGYQLARKEAGEAMDPMVQKNMQAMRQGQMAEGNRYAQNYYPNVPKTPTEMAMTRQPQVAQASPTPAVAPQPQAQQKPFDFGAAVGSSGQNYINQANKPFTGVSGT